MPTFLRTAALAAFTMFCALACAGADDEPIETVFDACEPLVIFADEGVTEERKASVKRAVSMWNEAAGTKLSTEDVPGAARIPLRFEKAAAAFYGFYDDERALIFVNTELRDARERELTIAHEIGHAFGLFHVEESERPSLMNRGNLAFGIMDDDVAALRDLWGDCER